MITCHEIHQSVPVKGIISYICIRKYQTLQLLSPEAQSRISCHNVTRMGRYSIKSPFEKQNHKLIHSQFKSLFKHLTEYLPMVTLSRLVTCHCIAASVTHVTRGHGAAPEVTIRGPRGQGACTARTSSQLPVRGGPGHNVTNIKYQELCEALIKGS